MNLRSDFYRVGTRLLRKVSTTSFQICKRIYHQFYHPDRQHILFIVGCQRSGTTLMQHIFEKDWETQVYGEFSPLSSDDHQTKLRLNAFDSVQRVIEQDRASLVVLKPLVETQNVLKLLDYFTDSKALFIYRHYKDVAASDLKLFGLQNGIHNLKPVVKNQQDNWRSEWVPDDVREIVLRFYAEDMNPYDAAALFWFMRNRLFFDLNLDNNPVVNLCKYEGLVMQPMETMRGIYAFIGHDFPGRRIIKTIHQDSVKKGHAIQLSPEVDRICRTLWAQLNEVYKYQWSA